MTSIKEKKFNPVYKIYKQNKRNWEYGAASSWEYNPESGCFFLTVAKQQQALNENGNPVFDWDKKGVMSLSTNDLGEILSVFTGKKNFLGTPKDNSTGGGLYHQTNKGQDNVILKIQYIENRGYSLDFSQKKNGILLRARHTLSFAEAEVLRVLIENVVWNMYNH